MSLEVREFDVANYLDDSETIAEYISQILEDGDLDGFLEALNDIARAKGISNISTQTGLSRESLYKAFKAGSHPRFDTVLKVLNTFGIKLQAVA